MSGITLAPILVSVYHRLDCLKRCVESLLRNPEAKDSEIWIVSDAAAKPEHDMLIRQVRQYILSIRGFQAVHPVFHEKNQGAGFSVLPTMNALLDNYGKIIQMEDDVVAAPDYLRYLNEGLEFYKDDKRVHMICAFKYPFKLPRSYKHDIYFLEQASPWGNATWRDRQTDDLYVRRDRYGELQKSNPALFEQLLHDNPKFMAILKADSDGRLNAWDVRQEYELLLQHKVCVFPRVSRSQNWGFDPRSDHCVGLQGVAIPRLADSRAKRVLFESFDVVGVQSEIQCRFLEAYKMKPLWRRVWANIRWFGILKTINFYFNRLVSKLGYRR